MQKAIIYIRFSTLEQREGVSLDRQRERCLEMCEANGWDVETILVDEGKSAFAGKHRDAGAAFGNFEAAARHGIHAGKVLVIERLSRLSRLDYNETYDLMRVLNKNGVTVACWDGGRIYKADEPIEFVSVIELLLKAKTAHEESQTKSDFGKDKWARRRADAASGKVATSNGPAWLQLDANRKWVVIEDRAQVVRQIFEWADQGDGSLRISRRLNEAKVQPWARYANRTPRCWERKQVSRIMANLAVIGDYQMMMEDSEGKPVPAGEPIRGYFPRIIEPDVFERVNLGADDRKIMKGGGRSVAVANLASALTRCGVCGGAMEYVRSRLKGATVIRDGKETAPLKQDQGYLYCRVANRRGDCANRTSIAYVGFERALLDSALHLALDDASFSRVDEVGRLTVMIADRRRDHAAAVSRAETLFNAFAENASEMGMKMALEAEKNAKSVQAEIDELQVQKDRASGQASAAEHLSRLNEIREQLYDDDLDVRRVARLKVAAGLNSVIEKIECQEDRRVFVRYKRGARVSIIYPGRGRRPAYSFDVNLAKPGDDHSDDPKVQALIGRMKLEAE